MNLIFLDLSSPAPQIVLSLDDSRAEHMLTILKMKQGTTCFVGIPQGPMGKATLTCIQPEGLHLSIEWSPQLPPHLYPIHLLVGMPRPQTARKILQAATSLGISRITFFQAEKGEPSYAQSTLWTTSEWETHLKTGAEQAFATTFPAITHAATLEEALALLDQEGLRIALDVYEGSCGLSAIAFASTSFTVAVGSERGWSRNERESLRSHGFTLAHLGPRVLRTETACVAAISVLLSRGAWA